MRKPLDEMTPEERRAERWYQEDHFQNLVSDMKPRRPLPTTWFGHWWLKWGELTTTTAQIVIGTVLISAAVCGGMWLAIACLSML